MYSLAKKKNHIGLLVIVGWCNERTGPVWIQVDNNKTIDIYGLLVQKHSTLTGYISSLAISYSEDGKKWTFITKEDGTERVVSYSSHPSVTKCPIQAIQ